MDSLERYIRTKGICHTASRGGRLAAMQEKTHLRVVVDLQPEGDLPKRLDAAFAEAKKTPDEDRLEEARRLLGE